MGDKPLNPKQTRFVAEYLIDLNATQAAIRAGYSKRTAQEQGSRLLSNVIVAAAVDAGIAKRAGKLEITAEKVLADIEATRLAASLVAQHATAIRASELQGKHIGMFVDRTEQNINATVHNAVDRPERETREQWIFRRSKELGIDPRLMGATAGAAD